MIMNDKKVEKIKVLVIDDNLFYREGVVNVLKKDPQIEVIGEGVNGQEAVDKAISLEPDLILMDLYMPYLAGIEATKKIKVKKPEINVIMLTGSTEYEDLIKAIKAGAIGYLLKDSSRDKLIEAVYAGSRGEAVISSSIAPYLLDEFNKLAGEQPSDDQSQIVEQLTAREQEILKFMAQGLDNKTIAGTIYVGESTVKKHVSSILLKLQVENRIQAGVIAAKQGLV